MNLCLGKYLIKGHLVMAKRLSLDWKELVKKTGETVSGFVFSWDGGSFQSKLVKIKTILTEIAHSSAMQMRSAFLPLAIHAKVLINFFCICMCKCRRGV